MIHDECNWCKHWISISYRMFSSTNIYGLVNFEWEKYDAWWMWIFSCPILYALVTYEHNVNYTGEYFCIQLKIDHTPCYKLLLGYMKPPKIG